MDPTTTKGGKTKVFIAHNGSTNKLKPCSTLDKATDWIKSQLDAGEEIGTPENLSEPADEPLYHLEVTNPDGNTVGSWYVQAGEVL